MASAIVLAYADNAKRVIGFSPPIMPTGNYGEDLLKIGARYYRGQKRVLSALKAIRRMMH